MRYALCGLVLALVGLAPGAHAQVFKCAGPGGNLTFSDRPCDAGSNGRMIQRERTHEEKLQEREQAYDAELRKQGRRQAEQEREWMEQSQRAAQPQAAPTVRHSGNDWQRRKEQQNAATSASSISNDGGRWDRAAEEQREREKREEARQRAAARSRNIPATNFTHCDAGFCRDNQGGTYHRVSPDFMTGPNGQSCHRAGNMWNCN